MSIMPKKVRSPRNRPRAEIAPPGVIILGGANYKQRRAFIEAIEAENRKNRENQD